MPDMPPMPDIPDIPPMPLMPDIPDMPPMPPMPDIPDMLAVAFVALPTIRPTAAATTAFLNLVNIRVMIFPPRFFGPSRNFAGLRYFCCQPRMS